ncbi:MAG: hypothetical protein GF383_05865 [Candidatus Lokiarchaeota archaeon]|nr:hypothetical protein [Candidatus Lokiarchaeota archaeon]MBD3339458.1 hypothetical protein [Candidatus Lokiarchaeota archaeon]
MPKIKYAYCEYCEKEINYPVKKSMDSLEKTIWIIIALATLGIGLIAFLIYNKYVRKKRYCPTCESKLIFSENAFEKPKEIEYLTKKEQIIAKASGKKTSPKPQKIVKETPPKEEQEKETIICPYCGAFIDDKSERCRYCHAKL